MAERQNRNGTTPVRIVVYTAIVLIVASVQSAFFGKVTFFGAVPSLLLAMTAAAGFFESENTGAVVGCGAGLAADLIGGTGIMFSALIYAIIGFFVGFIFGKKPRNKVSIVIADWSVALLMTVAVGAIVTVLNMVLSFGRFEFGEAFLYIILPEATGTYVFGYLACPIYLLVYKKRFFSEKNKQ